MENLRKPFSQQIEELQDAERVQDTRRSSSHDDSLSVWLCGRMGWQSYTEINTKSDVVANRKHITTDQQSEAIPVEYEFENEQKRRAIADFPSITGIFNSYGANFNAIEKRTFDKMERSVRLVRVGHHLADDRAVVTKHRIFEISESGLCQPNSSTKSEYSGSNVATSSDEITRLWTTNRRGAPFKEARYATRAVAPLLVAASGNRRVVALMEARRRSGKSTTRSKSPKTKRTREPRGSMKSRRTTRNEAAPFMEARYSTGAVAPLLVTRRVNKRLTSMEAGGKGGKIAQTIEVGCDMENVAPIAELPKIYGAKNLKASPIKLFSLEMSAQRNEFELSPSTDPSEQFQIKGMGREQLVEPTSSGNSAHVVTELCSYFSLYEPLGRRETKEISLPVTESDNREQAMLMETRSGKSTANNENAPVEHTDFGTFGSPRSNNGKMPLAAMIRHGHCRFSTLMKAETRNAIHNIPQTQNLQVPAVNSTRLLRYSN